MSEYLERAVQLRAIASPHYNCAQAVLIPFAEKAGADEETLFGVAMNFGGGMKRGSVCGAITGGLMALGLFGLDDKETVGTYYDTLKERHSGMTDCAELLKASVQNGIPRTEHCNGLVFECVTLVEELLRKNGKID
ncbi:MAG: C_GCAxxG_C_C family protein [Clostridia bacterium]|nr:C_GCAxxG_C_C family protein [Clostridia bacterium]